ncbi:ECU11_1065 [Encephalitozoon cuniculi GB-M1]|uniref:ECU11_1065 protein n=1 Tax=Encephalitozoon cuniculi (strain GB-M1) TaxID=284813 RepID=I7KFZ7_ENCCU|nr:uncharacterized protein ECU11_1065 [Encephalitozoon cuniculi GB-M1]CCI73998.1 ECU11_1065 [Encephalitozoon cuniculi GB-M1]
MSHDFTALDSQVTFIGSRAEDFGVREERYRMNIAKKIRTVVREMDRSSCKWPVCDQLKYRSFLSKIRRKIDERHST